MTSGCKTSNCVVKIYLYILMNHVDIQRTDILTTLNPGQQNCQFFNSSRPNDAYMHQLTGVSVVEIMECCLFGAKSVSESVLAYCYWTLTDNIQWYIKRKAMISGQKITFQKYAKWCLFCIGLDKLKGWTVYHLEILCWPHAVTCHYMLYYPDYVHVMPIQQSGKGLVSQTNFLP